MSDMGYDGPMEYAPNVQDFLDRLCFERAGHHSMNAYKCLSCGRVVLTIDVDPGVTPMMMGCVYQPCVGRMNSWGYPSRQPPKAYVRDKLLYEWRTPTLGEFDGASETLKDHYRNGGLVRDQRGDRPGAYVNGLRAPSQERRDT